MGIYSRACCIELVCALPKTNISPEKIEKSILKIVFLFQSWDMLVPLEGNSSIHQKWVELFGLRQVALLWWPSSPSTATKSAWAKSPRPSPTRRRGRCRIPWAGSVARGSFQDKIPILGWRVRPCGQQLKPRLLTMLAKWDDPPSN